MSNPSQPNWQPRRAVVIGETTRSESQPPSAAERATWQERACAAYAHQACDEVRALRCALEERLRQLIDAAPDPRTVYVDATIPLAQGRVDGVLFRLRGPDLLLVRACAGCGLDLFESAPLRDAADLGRALTV